MKETKEPVVLSPAMSGLIKAIDERVNEIWNSATSSQDAADSKDLGRALAKILAGQSLEAAFGSPGDWGYGTHVGDALITVYQERSTWLIR